MIDSDTFFLLIAILLTAYVPIYIWGAHLDIKYRCLPVYMCDVFPLLSIPIFLYVSYVMVTLGTITSLMVYLFVCIITPVLFTKFGVCGLGDIKMIVPLAVASSFFCLDFILTLFLLSVAAVAFAPKYFFLNEEQKKDDFAHAPFMVVILITLIILVIFAWFRVISTMLII